MGIRWCVLLLSVLQAVQGAVVHDRQCYGPLGCMSVSPQFYDKTHRPVNKLPKSREKVNTRFRLYTRENPSRGDVLLWSSTEEDIKKSHFKASRPTKLIVHGWIDNIDLTDWMVKMKDAYLTKDDCNVVLVDWKHGTLEAYSQAVANTRLVGAEIALFVNKLQNATGASPSTFHAIGHSLGAHVMGYAGERIRRLGRITGLDPAEPHFQKMPPSVRLDPTDAEFVDVIHTDGTPYTESLTQFFGMGMLDPVGHLDFYPNGGADMPGCGMANRIYSILTDGLTKGVREIVSCNHQRAIKYMMASIINSDCLPMGFECPSYEHFINGNCGSCGPDGSSCAPMGYHADTWKRFKNDTVSRQMYLVTNAHKPFCAYQYLVSVQTGAGTQPVKGNIYLTLKGTKGTAKVTFTKKLTTFYRFAMYNQITHSATDIGRVTSVDFLFDAGMFSRRRLPLDYVEVRSLVKTQALLRDASNEVLKFRPSAAEVVSGNQVTLHAAS